MDVCTHCCDVQAQEGGDQVEAQATEEGDGKESNVEVAFIDTFALKLTD